MKKLLLSFVALTLLSSAKAYKIEWGRNVIITNAIHEDLYVAGGTVTINAPVYGDLIVAGGTIYINDTVRNDLLVAGGTVHINGTIMDDIRCAGGQLFVQNNVGGDLVITGGNIVIERGVVINGGLITGGGEVLVNGIINDDVKAGGAKFTFNGIANKNFDCRSQELIMNGLVAGNAVIAARKITIGNNALFYNNVRYWNKPGKLDFGQRIKNGQAVYDPALKVETNSWYYLGHSTLLGLIWYLSVVFIFIALIEFLFSKTFKKAANTVTESLWRSLGWGFLFFIGVPVISVLLLVTIVGIPFGVIVMLSYIGLIILATIITSIVIANWYNIRFNTQWNYWQIVLSSLVLFILLKILTFTPFLGWFVMFAIACIAFGSLLRNVDWTGKHKMALQ